MHIRCILALLLITMRMVSDQTIEQMSNTDSGLQKEISNNGSIINNPTTTPPSFNKKSSNALALNGFNPLELDGLTQILADSKQSLLDLEKSRDQACEKDDLIKGTDPVVHSHAQLLQKKYSQEKELQEKILTTHLYSILENHALDKPEIIKTYLVFASQEKCKININNMLKKACWYYIESPHSGQQTFETIQLLLDFGADIHELPIFNLDAQITIEKLKLSAQFYMNTLTEGISQATKNKQDDIQKIQKIEQILHLFEPQKREGIIAKIMKNFEKCNC